MTSAKLSQLTIVIPTVARPAFVLRQLEYWANSGPHVVILDGATSPIPIPAHLVAPNIRYIHTGTRFNERLATAGNYVETAYCVLLPDDEFFLFGGLEAALDRLESDHRVIGCVGRCLYFFVDQGRFLVRDGYREWEPFSDDSTSVADRLHEDLPPNKTHKAQFAVMRSEHWKKMFENSYRQYFSCGYTYERLLNLQRSVLGKTVILEDLLWMRSMENPPISNESVPRVGGRDFVSWARNPQFSDEVSHYREIARRIITDGGISNEFAQRLEERFFVDGVERQAAKEAHRRRQVLVRTARLVISKSPKTLRRWSKRTLPSSLLKLTGWEGLELEAMYESLNSRGTRFRQTDLERVRHLALDTHKRLIR